jgi:hypothetical protein
MLISPDRRVRLSNQASVTVTPELEAVFVGAAADGPAFGQAATALAAAAQLGFVPAAGDVSLNDLPLAFASAAEFAAAFPGDDGWLARAVDDYFAAGGLRAWVVRTAVDDAAPIDAFLPPTPPIIPTAAPTGVAVALQIPSAGLLLLPHLEYLCLAGAEPPPPVPPPIAPGFRPITDFVAPPRPPVALPPVLVAVDPRDVLARVSAMLAVLRPDMLCLFALPVGADQTQTAAVMVRRADAYLHGAVPPGPDRPFVQAFAPLLRDPSGEIVSPSGLIAGVLAAAAQSDGVWRSIAGRTLPSLATPLRKVESAALDSLRRSGITALRFAPGGTVLDDDILGCRDIAGAAPARSGGARRLMGWLLRNLQSFGEQLVFENVLDDGRVELALTSLFATLLKRGALSGRQVTDAVTITRRDAGQSNAVAFDIGLAIAVAVETIRLSFMDGTVTTTTMTTTLGQAA